MASLHGRSRAANSKRARACKRRGPHNAISKLTWRDLNAALVSAGGLLGLRHELEDALGGRGRCGIRRLAPRAVERALRHLVLLRHGAELLALRVGDGPVDGYR